MVANFVELGHIETCSDIHYPISSEVVSSHAVFEAYVHLQKRALCFDAMNTHDLGFFWWMSSYGSSVVSLLAVMDVLRALQTEVCCVSIQFIQYTHTHCVSSRGLCRHRAVVDATRASRRKQPPPECLVVVGQSTSTLHAAENHRLSVDHRVLHRLHGPPPRSLVNS